MTITTVTNAQFNAAVEKYRRSRRKNPKHTQANGYVKACVNLTADGGRCVASQIMHDLGVRGGMIDEVGVGCSPDGMQGDASSNVRLTVPQLRRLRFAQATADRGGEWWEALRGAKLPTRTSA